MNVRADHVDPGVEAQMREAQRAREIYLENVRRLYNRPVGEGVVVDPVKQAAREKAFTAARASTFEIILSELWRHTKAPLSKESRAEVLRDVRAMRLAAPSESESKFLDDVPSLLRDLPNSREARDRLRRETLGFVRSYSLDATLRDNLISLAGGLPPFPTVAEAPGKLQSVRRETQERDDRKDAGKRP